MNAKQTKVKPIGYFERYPTEPTIRPMYAVLATLFILFIGLLDIVLYPETVPVEVQCVRVK